MTFSNGQPRRRFLDLLALLCVFSLLLGPGSLYNSRLLAQDAAPADSSPGSSSSGPETSMFMHMVKSVGWLFGIVLGSVSVSLIALIVLLMMDLRMSSAIPPGFVEEFSDIVNKRRFKEAYELARNDGSYLGRVMTTGMSRLQYGIEDAREAAYSMIETIKAGKEQLIAYLATIGTLGPLLGLVGTVYGMIQAFMVLASGSTIDAKGLAGAISHALVVTLIGVAMSVPAIFFHTFFRNRLQRLSMDTGNVADDLLTQMYHNSKKPAPAEVPADSRAAAAPPPVPAIKQK
jgi:biopolymer transport protein ExbB